MTIEEAIKHAREVAEKQNNLAKTFREFKDYGNPKSTITSGADRCKSCAEEHEQLAEWLEELVVLRKAYELACSELDKHANNPNCELEPISNRGEEAIQEFFIDKATEKLKND